mgnify:CR=1 FL=1
MIVVNACSARSATQVQTFPPAAPQMIMAPREPSEGQDAMVVAQAGFERQSEIMAVRYKRNKESSPLLMRSDAASEERVLDILNSLSRNGLPSFDRPQHIGRRYYEAAHREASAAVQPRRPWVATLTRDKFCHSSQLGTPRNNRPCGLAQIWQLRREPSDEAGARRSRRS